MMTRVAKFSVKQYVFIYAVLEPSRTDHSVSPQLMNSNRYGEARTAYREVQERHEDIKKIERTLTELAQLFNDVGSFSVPS